MANKIRDYTKLAADICAAVGKDNILSATHCATRLRLVLRETPSDEVTKQISEMPAVIKVMESGGQYQVVIGTHAKDVYEALAQLLDLDNSTAAAPRKPKTFARYAKIKSFQALGTKMCSPESSPCPVSPPVPMAMAPLFCW